MPGVLPVTTVTFENQNPILPQGRNIWQVDLVTRSCFLFVVFLLLRSTRYFFVVFNIYLLAAPHRLLVGRLRLAIAFLWQRHLAAYCIVTV